MAKPSPVIYAAALDRLGVPPTAAAFIDDQAAYCDGAAALGIRTVQLARDPKVRRPDGDVRVARSLLGAADVLGLGPVRGGW